MDSDLYYIWLSTVLYPASKSFSKLISRFITAEFVFMASEDEIAEVIESGSKEYAEIIKKDLGKAEKILDFCVIFMIFYLKILAKKGRILIIIHQNI